MLLPTITGLIKRRILVNYRADPQVMRSILPEPFKPLLQGEYAVAGICLIRLEQLRPAGLPGFVGMASENAAHRFAVEWEESGQRREGVFIPKRNTDSAFTVLAGGRLFPGEHEAATFNVRDSDGTIRFSLHSEAGTSLELSGSETDAWPHGSCFGCVEDASRFFEAGRIGYSPRSKDKRMDGLELDTFEWSVRPLALDRVHSSFFDDRSRFPEGSIAFDHALIMRNLRHQWHAVAPR